MIREMLLRRVFPVVYLYILYTILSGHEVNIAIVISTAYRVFGIKQLRTWYFGHYGKLYIVCKNCHIV